MNKVSISILSADMSRLGSEILRAEEAGCDWLHFDVMDGIFVPNFTFGSAVLNAIKPITGMLCDVHLMVNNPQPLIKLFAEAGADLITFHLESNCNVTETINMIKGVGLKAGISIKPNTPVSEIFSYIDMVDLVLIMTVEPGFGGQKFMPDMMSKVTEIRNLRPTLDIEVDGGINAETATICTKAGANVLVSGSYLFSHENIGRATDALKLC